LSLKAYWGNGSIAPFILNLDSRWRRVVSLISRPLYTRKLNPALSEQEAEWGTEPFSTFRGRKSPLCPVLNKTPRLFTTSSSPYIGYACTYVLLVGQRRRCTSLVCRVASLDNTAKWPSFN
jgi:hypothetical protein